jgi:pilus assembly protein CpaF
MSQSLVSIVASVRSRVQAPEWESGFDTSSLSQLVTDEIALAAERGHRTDEFLGREDQLHALALAELSGLGPLQPLLDDPSIEEIWINSPTQVFIARGGVSSRTDIRLTDQQVRDAVERLLSSTGRRVDVASPFVDASLPDGSRLHVVIPDITAAHWAVNIRKFSRQVRGLDDLVATDSVTAEAAQFLRESVNARHNILVSGATQAGKTTMLNALLGSAGSSERVVTVEETFELSLSAPDWVALQCRQASLEGGGEVTLRRLIKEALRMRPDRIVVGEVREAESLDLLIALNSGLPGACSIHANSAADALVKLCTLPLLAGRNIDSQFINPTVATCVNLVVHCELGRNGRRRVREIIAPTGALVAGQVEHVTLFHRVGGELVATPEVAHMRERFSPAHEAGEVLP